MSEERRGRLGCSTRMLISITLVLFLLFIVGLASGALGASLLKGLEIPDFLRVPRPDIKLIAEEVFPIFGFSITNSILAAWLTIMVLVGLFFAATRKMKIVPTGLQNLMEAALELLLNFVESVAGKKNGHRFFPLIATIFLFVLMNAWLALLPGFGSITIHTAEGETHLLRSAGTDINMPLALALISFVFVEYWGISSLGWRYIGKFFRVGQLLGGIGQLLRGRIRAGIGKTFSGAIDAFVGLLEMMSEMVRILSFTFRLFGNMTAGEILLLVAVFLVPWVMALPFYGLELLVGFVQALIFGGLTLVFATVAVTSHEEH